MGLSGGCQCGAVRFRVEGEPGRASICHCRMCQKAFGGPFGALVTVTVDQLTWTRGQRATFQSSDKIQRGFCATCGTPLTYEWSADKIDLAVFAFDDPSAVAPVVQLSVESRPAWMDHLADLPVRPALGATGAVVSRQHPDHDTPPPDPLRGSSAPKGGRKERGDLLPPPGGGRPKARRG